MGEYVRCWLCEKDVPLELCVPLMYKSEDMVCVHCYDIMEAHFEEISEARSEEVLS